MAMNILKLLAVFVLGISGGVFSDRVLSAFFAARPPAPVYINETKEIIIRENMALTEAAEKTKKTVVGIKTTTAEGVALEGSGLILTSDGLMVTLGSLIPKGSKFSFFAGGKAVPFQILKRDLENNLALVKIEGNNLATARFANLEKTKIGETVFLSGSGSVNSGIVKNFNDDLIETNILEEKYMAGSPLFNIEGQVLGINKIDAKGRVSAVPVSKIREFTGL